MNRRARVPAWLGFSWWWLLGATVLADLLRPHLAPLSYLLGLLILVWCLVQPAWLKFAYPTSRAVYWYASAFLVFAVLKTLELFQGPAAFLRDGWMGTMLVLAGACCYIAGACYFTGEWREFVQYSQGYELPMSYPWAILFGMYYFQYKLHDLYEDQRIWAERITLGPG
jgi:hypothetical protein